MPTTPDGRILIRPLDVFSGQLAIPIQERRTQPIWLPFAFSIGAQTVFELPEGYTADIPDEPRSNAGPGMRFHDNWAQRSSGREIVWTGSLTVDTVEIAPEDYEKAGEFARRVVQLLRQGIVAHHVSSAVPRGTP
jgi:hypothetical protein